MNAANPNAFSIATAADIAHAPFLAANALEATTEAQMARVAREFRAAVLAQAVTPESPEAVEYMTDTGGSFEDFLHDCCFRDVNLGVHFLYEQGVEGSDGARRHPDSNFVSGEA